MKNGVGLDVMRLEAESNQKLAKEVANRQAESALEVRQEHHPLSCFRSRLHLISGKAAGKLWRDSAARIEPVDVVTRDVRGAFPASSGSVCVGIFGGGCVLVGDGVVGILLVIRLRVGA